MVTQFEKQRLLRSGVIGVGAIGRSHARIYADLSSVELVAVADKDPSQARHCARRYGATPYTDYREMLDKRALDLVSVAVPTTEHLTVTLGAMDRGCHVLVEKPIADSVQEAERMIAASRDSGVVLMVGHVERFNPAVVELKRRLRAGELGRVFQIDARRQGPFPARIRDVGVVIDLAVHDLDVILYVTERNVTRVFAETERRVHTSREDLLSGLMRLDDGTVGTLSVNWLTPTKIRELRVTGERGMFRVDYLTQDLCFYEDAESAGSEWETLSTLPGVTEGRMLRHVVPKKEPLLAEIESFLAAVKGQKPTAVTGEEALRALVVARAFVTSGIDQRVVTFPPTIAAATGRQVS